MNSSANEDAVRPLAARPLRVGIVGAGNMGATHARHWANVPGVTVVAVADPQVSKAQTVAASSAAVFDSVESLLKGATVDVVSVCVPSHLHTPVTLAAIAHNKHVFCEKPFALTVADCDQMITAAEAAKVLLSVGQVVRFFPEYANAKRLIESGAVGTPAAVRVRRGGGFPHTDTDWFAEPQKSGGVVFDLLVHDLDWLLWCFGPIVRVHAHTLTQRLADKTVTDLDYALVTLRHQSGVISHAEGTWADPGGFVTAFEIAGDSGLLVHDSRRTGVLTKHLRGSDAGTAFPLPSSPLDTKSDPYYLEIAAFARSVQFGEPLAVTPQEARKAVAVAAAITQSAQTGRAVEMEAW